MKKRLILATALFSLGLVACQQHNPANTLVSTTPNDYSTPALTEQNKKLGGVLKSMLTLNEAIIDVKEG